MLKPKTYAEHMRTKHFIADVLILVGYSASTYFKAWKVSKAKIQPADGTGQFLGVEVQQGVADLPTCKNDIVEISGILKRYGFSDTGENCYMLDDSPSYNEVFKARK